MKRLQSSKRIKVSPNNNRIMRIHRHVMSQTGVYIYPPSPPPPPPHNPMTFHRYGFVYMQMSHWRCCVVASARHHCTQSRSSTTLTRTSHRVSSSETSWTETGWWLLPFRSLGRPCQCQSRLERPSWTHLGRKKGMSESYSQRAQFSFCWCFSS